MIERNPGVVSCAAWDRRKWHGAMPCDPIDPSALCDENVAQCEPRDCGHGGSDCGVSFRAPAHGDVRNRRQNREVPAAVHHLVDVLAAVLCHEHSTRRRSDAYGVGDRAKRSWIGGVKDSCEG